MNGRGAPGRDALGSLLSGFSGLEGDVFGRPKTMQDQKKKLQGGSTSVETPVHCPAPAIAISDRVGSRHASSCSAASRATPPPPAPVAAPNTSSDFFDAGELDQLVKSR